MLLSGRTLYGTGGFGGANGYGSVFGFNLDNSTFTNLYSFTDGTDGAYPMAGLVSGTNFYGAASSGGSGHGTIFSLTTNGTGFTVVHTFSAGVTTSGGILTNSDGAYPVGGLILSGNVLYGTTSSGGTSSVGTIFSLTLPSPPQLTMSRSGNNVILSWPANAAGFTLQFTTNLSPAFWSSNSPGPIILNGQNTVTNPISGTQMFYRLSQ